MPIGVDHRAVEKGGGLPLPDLQANFVDRFHQPQHLLIILEAPAEVAGRGWIGNPLRAQGVQIDLVVAKRLQVLQALAVAQNVVGDVQHVIRFVIRQMDLQQMHVGIDGVDQPHLAGQQMHRADPAMTKAPAAIGHFIANRAGRKHRAPAAAPLASRIESLLDSALASQEFLGCSIFHSKRLRACDGQRVVITLYTHQTRSVSSLFFLSPP